ncbi:MAG: SDR family oxidoreductase [Defluviitaleaceae bacterium]|nr:SDR family oxidoreductase [Defluviitaleaceae bacterium]
MIFAGKRAIVTGGANGIGRCIAESLLECGANVHIIDIDEEAGRALAASRNEAVFFHGDVAEKTILEHFASILTQPIDFLINNACIGQGGLLTPCPYEDFEYVQKVGVTAPYYLTSLLLQRDLLAKDAAIVNIASTRAAQSQANTEAYSAAKGGIVALTHAMAVSLSGRARVNAISPGWIDTVGYDASPADHAQHPVGRIGVPKDIAQMVLYLCDREKSGFITGQNFVIDGGMSKLMVYHGDCGWRLSEK